MKYSAFLLLMSMACQSFVHGIICADDVTDSAIVQDSIAPMLKITWRLGADLPQGFQDSDGGILGDRLITIGGFCSGGLEEDNRRKTGRYPRGFLKKGWSLDLRDAESDWTSLPDLPGPARQGLSAAIVDDALYVWGGFSYEEPYCYRDGWRFSREGDRWQWSELPPFPWPINSTSLATVGSRIYACGGSDYNAERFFTETDRAGGRERLGARLLMFDTNALSAGWQELEACPGTPRWVHTMAAIDGELYVIGGATGDTLRDGSSVGYCTVVDNWKYNTADRQWTRLRDLPVASGNFPRSTNNVFQNRYILLPGGYQYGHVLNPDGSLRQPYGQVHSAIEKSGLCNDVFVYDTRSGLFGTADRLPIDNNLPMTVIRDDTIYLIGGETGGGVIQGHYYGHHPDLLLIGQIEVVEAQP
ncbi:MAG: kelch repeat-containing protein [Planctomycetaceae bacterium]